MKKPGEAIEDYGLVPIDEVARRLGLRASAIRYYEERGLVEPAARRAGRRWYGPAEIRRLAVVRYWQRSGLMSLDEIAAILAGPAGAGWAHLVTQRIEALRRQQERIETTLHFLEHVVDHHGDCSPDGCPHYEALIWATGDPLDHPGHADRSAGQLPR